MIAAAKASGAAVIISGNIYVFGEDSPLVLSLGVPYRATDPLGQLGRAMEAVEAAYRDAP